MNTTTYVNGTTNTVNDTQQNNNSTDIVYQNRNVIIRQYNNDNIILLQHNSYINSTILYNIVLSCVLCKYNIIFIIVAVILHTVFTLYNITLYNLSPLNISIITVISLYIILISYTIQYYNNNIHKQTKHYKQSDSNDKHRYVIYGKTNNNIIAIYSLSHTLQTAIQVSNIVIDYNNITQQQYTNIVSDLINHVVQYTKTQNNSYRILIDSNSLDTLFNNTLVNNNNYKITLKRILLLNNTFVIQQHIYDLFIELDQINNNIELYHADDNLLIRSFKPTDQPYINNTFVAGMRGLIMPTIKLELKSIPIVYIYLITVSLLLIQNFILQIIPYNITNLQYSITILLISVLIIIVTLLYFHNIGIVSYINGSLGVYGDNTELTDLQDTYLYYSNKQNSCMFVATLHNINLIVGMVALDDIGNNVCELRRMNVLPSYRDHRIGTKLCNVVITYAKTHGYNRIILGTSSDKVAAIKLYEKFGFKLVSSHRWLNGIVCLNYAMDI